VADCGTYGNTDAGREASVRNAVIVKPDGDLLEVVLTLRSPGRFPSRLYGGQQNGDQNADNGDHDQEFDQRESTTRT